MLNAQPSPLRFPQDILRFLYWVLFKPITLHRYINKIDPSLSGNDDPSLFVLWRRRKEHPEFIPIIQLSSLHILITPWLIAFPVTYLFQLGGFEVYWFGVVLVVAFDMAFGVFSVVTGVVFGVAFSVAFSVVASVALSVVTGVALSVAGVIEGVIPPNMVFGVAFGVVFGVVFGVAAGVAAGVTGGGWTLGLGLGVGIGIDIGFGIAAGVGEGVVTGVAFGMVFGVVFSVAFILSYLRLPLYIVQIPWAFMNRRLYKGGGLVGSPVVWDEMIRFPLLGLDSLLFQIAKQNRQEGMEAIAFVSTSFRQGWAAKRALLELTAYDVSNARDLNTIAEISNNLSWLPDDARMNMQDLLLGLEQSSQHARAALESETLYNKQEQLRMGLSVVERMRGGLALAQNSDVARQMIPALEGWKSVFTQELTSASGKEQIPNVYHSGTPLIKESKTFKGRRDLFRSLSNELINPSGQRPALLLFGARRMGKSSTLKQLPVQLGPQIIPATVDLQSLGAVETASSLLYLIAREIVRAARQERRLTLPELTREQIEQEPYSAFQEWLEKVDKALGDYYWVLLALDEFEALGEMLSADRIDERVFQTLRGIIQHHPRITILVSGAHTLEELLPLWSNYLINTKMLKVGPLENADARELITHPIENFPLTYDEDAVSLLLHETGCHPNWLQFTCRELVENLNNESRFYANRADVEFALNKVPQVLAGDFKDLWEGRDSSDLMRSILKFIATAKEDAVSDSKLLEQFSKQESDLYKALAYLSRRDILINENGQYYFNARLLRRWVAKQQS